MHIRRFRPGEEPALFQVYFSAIHQVASQHYSSEQIHAWAPPDLDPALWCQRMRGIQPFVAEVDGLVVGYADLQADGLIDHFFVSGRHPRQGVGRALMQRIHQGAAERGLAALYAHVSRAAQGFFAHFGFELVAQQSPTVRGVVVPNAHMRKPLPARPVLSGQGLAFAYLGRELFSQLSFAIQSGLTLVRGGDGRGKTTLLRLMAGELATQGGTLQRQAATLYFEHLADEAHDAEVAQAWLDARRPRFAAWSASVAEALVQAFGLAEHMAKPLYMLSTGSRRKVGLVAAAASGAAVTLIDSPFAALDARSCRVVEQLLAEAASSNDRAWVLADHALPPALAEVPLAGQIDLGD